ncbi:MAG: S26 family signal peptidase [Candidatus Dormibacteria bacterium]
MRGIQRWLKWGTAVLLGLVLVAFGAWWITGGRWDIMTTASMSPRLPVGTLVFTRPLTGQLRVGGVYAFTPPGQTVTFIHQVVSGNPTVGFHTKGYLNSDADPWVITRANVHAVAVAWVPDLGWALLALPIWAAALALWSAASLILPRQPARCLGWLMAAAALTIPVWIWRFVVAAQVVASVANKGMLHMYLVSTGMLPAMVSVHGHYLGILAAGHARAFSAFVEHLHGPVALNLQAALPWWGQCLVVIVVIAPMTAAGRLLWTDLTRSQAMSQVTPTDPTPDRYAVPATTSSILP